MTIAHAAERTYTRGSVAFGPFLGVPKIENYMIPNPKASQGSRFFRGRVKTLKTLCPCIDDPKFDYCLRKSFTTIFQEIQQPSQRFEFLICQKRVKKL